jgi:hypothetical protein
VFDGSLGTDIGEKGVFVVGLIGSEFVDQHAARNGHLLGQPGAGERIFREQFLEEVFTEVTVFGSGIHGNGNSRRRRLF